MARRTGWARRSALVLVLVAAAGPVPTAAAAPAVVTTSSGGCSRPFEDARVRCLFDATGAPETWVVPPDVSFVSLDVWGAQGASLSWPDGRGVAGQRGSGVSADVDVRAGESLTILVGTRGAAPGSGGGATTVSDADGRWIVAGGGGGATTRARRGGVTTGPTAIRPDRPGFSVEADRLGKAGDGRVSVEYHWYDATGAPSVVVDRAGTGGTSGFPGTVWFSVRFSEPVSGFTAADVRVAGHAARSGRVTVTEVAPFDGTHYGLGVVGSPSVDALDVSVRDGAAVDRQFSRSTASTPASVEKAALTSLDPSTPTGCCPRALASVRYR